MKFIIALDGRSPIFRQCEEWHTESFDGEHDGLFLDGNCICILKAGQASFLNILKRDESHFSSIEITDDKITIQPIEAESADYERPTGEIDFKENKRMGMTIKEAKRVLKRAGYRVNEMALELPSEKKKRLTAKADRDEALGWIGRNLVYPDSTNPDEGLAAIFGNRFLKMCEKEGIEWEDVLYKTYMHGRVYPFEACNKDGHWDKHLEDSIVDMMDKNLVVSLVIDFIFKKEFINEYMSDEIAEHLNEVEKYLNSGVLGVKEAKVDEEKFEVIIVINNDNISKMTGLIASGFDIEDHMKMAARVKAGIKENRNRKVNEMAIERPSSKKERLDAEKAADETAKKTAEATRNKVVRIFNNIIFGEEPDQGIGGSIFGTDFWNMCDKDGFSPEDAIDKIRPCSTNGDIFRSFYPGNSKDLSDLAEVMADYYLKNKKHNFKFYFYFTKMFVNELLTDEMADYLNFIERWVGSAGYVSKCTVDENALIVSIRLPYEENLESFEKNFLNGLGISDAWHKVQSGEDVEDVIGRDF